ncbi:MauE/DoxX family redox-associated membrane protein [Acetobacter sp. UBA5411]|uniref:MauE/DoxX family redox-associated membrane protein n=1 Tax=Acetobacter sp. UBA5411 TaxID=1945905 RepID=UPI0025C69CCB|nr:MauE/DoxX family redox-associated membrane protein [Acetobacter sp. UBA5411]
MNAASLMMGGLSALCAGGVGIMFLVAGVSKLREHDLFLGTLSSYRLLPAWSLEAAAWGLGAAEVLVGLMLLSGVGRGVGGVVAAGLLVLFAVAMGINVMRGRTDLSCGCTPGQKGETLSWSLVLRTLGCALPALLPVMAGAAHSISVQLEGVACGVALWVLWQALRVLPDVSLSDATGERA